MDVTKIGAWGALGVLCGIAFAIWSGAQTTPGFVAIIIVFFLVFTVISGIFGFLTKKPKDEDNDQGGDDEKDE